MKMTCLRLAPSSMPSPTTVSRTRKERFARLAFGLAAAALCIGQVNLALAQTYHPRTHASARDFMAQAYPGGFIGGPAVGNWRYSLSTHRRTDRAYPMDESSGPATATGGPSGGIN